MSLMLVDLQIKYSHTWLHEHMVVYADDIRWIIRSTAQALEGLIDLQNVLMTLQAFGFNVNLHKSVAMLRLQGKETPTFLRHWVSRLATGLVLTLPERRWQLPLGSKTTYLGVIIGYNGMLIPLPVGSRPPNGASAMSTQFEPDSSCTSNVS